jgi:hypothetical protein
MRLARQFSLLLGAIAVIGFVAHATPAYARYNDGPNLYQYVQSKPTIATDPLGLRSIDDMGPAELRVLLKELEAAKNYDYSQHGGQAGPNTKWLWERIVRAKERIALFEQLADLERRKNYDYSQHGGQAGPDTPYLWSRIVETKEQLGINYTRSEPYYNPTQWNDPRWRNGNNCYAYAMNDLDPSRTSDMDKPQPGSMAGIPILWTRSHTPKITCDGIRRRALADGNGALTTIDCDDRCPSGQYKVALFVDENVDYHWYRQNPVEQGCTWSHKPGPSNATALDASGNSIIDPRKADRNYGSINYSETCGCFCVPATGIRVR